MDDGLADGGFVYIGEFDLLFIGVYEVVFFDDAVLGDCVGGCLDVYDVEDGE